MINKPLLGLICLTLVLSIIPVAVIAFNAPVSPPSMASMVEPLKPNRQDLGVDIPVTIVPGMKHADMIARPEALQVVVRAICRQN